MSKWGAAKAKRVFAALLRIGWTVKRSSGSHFTLSREGWPDYSWAFHDSARKRLDPQGRLRTAEGLGCQRLANRHRGPHPAHTA